jgi:Kdo2-lipid IVA lauroyltransferase/acyltransferase
MLKLFLKLYARLPLVIIHSIGATVGWLIFVSNKKVARQIESNLTFANVANHATEIHNLARNSALEIGKGIAETLVIWFKPQAEIEKWVKDTSGWGHVETAQAKHKGIIFLTPHLGCYEITALHYASQNPISILYRPHRKNWLAPIVEAGRMRNNITLAPTNMKGVRTLLRTLKHGGAIGILPDQVPNEGEGEWADFFGRPAYTMTLVSKLKEATDATILLAFGERLPWGRGYIVHIEPFNDEISPNGVNQAIERLIRKYPAQYLWSYNRHKQPSR